MYSLKDNPHFHRDKYLPIVTFSLGIQFQKNVSLIALVRYDISFKKSSERKTRGSQKWVIDYIVQYLLRTIILWKNWCLKESVFGPIKAQNWLLLLNQPHKDYLCEIYPLFSVSQLTPIHKTSLQFFLVYVVW